MSVPETWYELDVHPASRNESISRLVRDRTRDRPELATHRTDLVRLLRTIARLAADSGAIYCGGMADVLGGIPLTASIMIAIVRALRDGTALDTDPAAIAASLRPRKARTPSDTWRDVILIDLPHAGPAARTNGVEDVELPGESRPVRVVITQTLVPVPGTDQVALISASSPILDLASPFHDLFDAITSTFRFVPG